MNSPIFELIDEFHDFSRTDLKNIGLVLVAALIGLLLGWWFARRRAPEITGRQALLKALMFGIPFPVITCCILYLLRFTHLGSGPGASTSAFLKLAVPVFASLAVVRIVARVLRGLFPESMPMRTLVNWLSVLIWFALVAHLLGLLPLIVTELDSVVLPLGKVKVSLLTLLQGAGLVIVTVFGALWLSSYIEGKLMAMPIDMSLRLVLSRFLRALMFTLALLVALAVVGIDLTVLSVFGGALGVGLGLGLQKIAANYISGFAILLEGSFKVGDNVQVDQFEGQIKNIHARYTVVQAPSGRESIVPNETFIINRVENFSLHDKGVSFSTKLQVDYSTDVELARSLMVEAALEQPRVLKDPGPSATLTDFPTNGLELTLFYWIADPENGRANIRGDINMAIWKRFKANNIKVPYPQQVVHLASPETSQIFAS